MTNLINEPLTDEQMYEALKGIEDHCFISADEWKEQRLKQLAKEGKQWSK